MSRIGRQPIPVPSGVTVSIEPESVRVKGPKGELTERVHRDIDVMQEGEQLLVTRPTDRGEHRALHGLTRTLVANMVQGVTAGYEKRLEIQGVGYRAQLKGKNLELAVGYSHPVPIPAPDGIEFEVPQPTRIVVKGISKQLVGETAAIIRKQRPPEPYKGKGIRYEGEYVPQGGQARMSVTTKENRRLVAPPARAREGLGHRRAPADLGVPLQPRPLRAAGRRRRRPHAGRRQLVRARAAQASAKPTAPSARGRCSPSARKPPASRRPCSTAAATATTVTCAAFADAIREAGITV